MSRRKPIAVEPDGIAKGPGYDFDSIIRETTRLQMATQHIPAIVAEEIRKGWKQLPNTDPRRSPKSWFFDPLSLQYSLGYKDRKFSLTYDTLKRIAGSLGIVSAIINTRCAQIAAFSQPYRWTKSLGFVIKHKDPDHPTTPAEMAFIKELEAFILNCGRSERNPYSRVPRDDFDSFLRKIVRDSLVLDSATFEVIRDRLNIPYEFVAVDASTIRIASDDRYVGVNSSYQQRYGFVPSVPARFQGLYEGRQYGTRTADGERVEYVQLLNGQVENIYSDKDLGWGVRNPRTDIYIQGYGFGELEQLITIVTAHLNAETYNRNFFCVTKDTLVHTNLGMLTIPDLLNKSFMIWNGYSWKESKAYKTGAKPVAITKLWNGLGIRTSTKHKFLTITKESTFGEPEWVEQKDLKNGDYVLVNNKPIECQLNTESLHVGKKYSYKGVSNTSEWCPTIEAVNDPELWEMLGFALGDGYFPETDGSMQINPHHEKDKGLFDKFLNTCNKYSIKAYVRSANPNIQRSDGGYGYPTLFIGHKAFIQWLYDLGFQPSNKTRRFPASLMGQPSFIRQAVLRGLFSADGHRHRHVSGYSTPQVFSRDADFRQDIVLACWSVGVPANEIGAGKERKGNIDIQDIRAFVNNIGYLQAYKNEDIVRTNKSIYKWDTLPKTTILSLCSKFKNHPDWLVKLDHYTRLKICAALRGVSSISRPKIIDIHNKLGLEIPYYLNYCTIKVDYTELTDTTEDMYDIEVFDDQHIFLANNIAVHNTNGTAAKGILNFKGDAWSPDQLEAFQRMWSAQMSGVEGAFKVPVTQSEGIEWIDISKTQREAEYMKYIEYLTKVSCAVYLIDPAEVGFNASGGVSQQPLFESASEWKLKASRDKGLKPLLKFISKLINKYIIDQIDDHFTFEFVGLDEMSEQDKHEMLIEQLSSYMTLNEVRRTLDLPDMPYGDVPMNATYLQALQLQMQLEMGVPAGSQGGAHSGNHNLMGPNPSVGGTPQLPGHGVTHSPNPMQQAPQQEPKYVDHFGFNNQGQQNALPSANGTASGPASGGNNTGTKLF